MALGMLLLYALELLLFYCCVGLCCLLCVCSLFRRGSGNTVSSHNMARHYELSERLAEYGWKPRRSCLAQTKTIEGLNSPVHA